MDRDELLGLPAAEAARLVAEGAISSQELVDACLARVSEVDGQVQAWAFLDPDHARAQARAADEWRGGGRPLGPLHGVPIGIKDIIDTADMPTENGSVLHAGRTPSRDASLVERLRAAGAVILGKTVTTEFAAYAPGKTRNPHDPDHTPGGSSSGSAAAVAAGMVPLAVGSQTNGSVIRPAAFCGVYGFKPTFGSISRHGMLRVAPTLDQVGVFARTVDDLAFLAESLVGYDARDPDCRPRAHPPFRVVAATEPPLPPMLAFVKTPPWARAEEETKAAFGELVELLGDRVEEVELFPSAVEAWTWHRTIMEAEMAASLEREWDRGRDRLSEPLRALLERGRAVSAVDYQRAIARSRMIHDGFAELFEQRYDAILTPAAPGPAPKGLGSTGDPAFCTLWTLCGMPAVTLPLLQGSTGLPIGVQLVGPRDGDARLLRTARWLATRVSAGR
jgi:Asp-tRNA(Asn)/Glu-tRNA(Gln) amidotransferase A subunit family amidase